MPGLANLAIPEFDKVDKFYSKEYYGNYWPHTTAIQADGEKTLCRRKVKIVEKLLNDLNIVILPESNVTT